MILESDSLCKLSIITNKSNENIKVMLVDRDKEWCCLFAGLLQTETDIHLINTSGVLR